MTKLGRSHWLIIVWLRRKGEGSPYDFWKEYGKHLKYSSVVRYFSDLKKAGLIELVREEDTKKHSYFKKRVYRLKF